MRIYVAGKWEEKVRVRLIQNVLKSEGHTITFNWTAQPNTLNETDLVEQCLRDVSGVLSAEALVAILVSEEKYYGESFNRYIEIGIAIGISIPIYIVGRPRSDFLFKRYPLITVVDSIREVIDALHYSNKT